MTFTVDILGDTPMMMRPEPSLFKEVKAPVDAQVWYTDGSNWGQASSWTTFAMQTTTDAI